MNTLSTHDTKRCEDALHDFANRLLDSQEFIAEVENFVQQIRTPGWINSLAQMLIRYTAPGVPDTYQGSELWNLRLVDPDNRGPVDYALRRRMLAEIESGIAAAEIVKRMGSGMPKLWVAYKALHLRNEHPEWFGAEAAYTPLYAEGAKKEHVVGYLRGDGVATIVPRWNARLGAGWAATMLELPPGRWQNVLAGTTLDGGRGRLQALFEPFPVALLVWKAE